jgi:predicted MFS family arabinose efflux permease
MLILFGVGGVGGVGGVAGNLLAGRLLSRNKVGTTWMHPIMLGASYLILHFFASPAILPMVLIVVLWGATHTSGLIVTQVWLTSEAPEAPEFVTGLYISFINLGVTLGATTGGWFLARMGMEGTIVSGLVFCALTVATVATKVLVYGARQPSLAPETQAVLH